MTNNHGVFNVSRGYFIKRKAALKGIHKDCNLKWVIENETVRDLSLAEQLSARNEQAKTREPLEYAELPGLTFKPPIGQEKANSNSLNLVWESHKFITEVVQ